MSKLSRRTMVAGAAALPALAVPAVASFSPDHPDAELLRLGEQIDDAGQKRDALEVRLYECSDEHKAACLRAGIPPEVGWPEAKAQGMSEKEWWDKQDERSALAAARHAIPYSSDWDAVCKEHSAMLDRVGDLAVEILDLTPTTLDGLRVQAKALNWGLPDWPRLGSDDYGESLIRSLFALVGVGLGGYDHCAENQEV